MVMGMRFFYPTGLGMLCGLFLCSTLCMITEPADSCTDTEFRTRKTLPNLVSRLPPSLQARYPPAYFNANLHAASLSRQSSRMQVVSPHLSLHKPRLSSHGSMRAMVLSTLCAWCAQGRAATDSLSSDSV